MYLRQKHPLTSVVIFLLAILGAFGNRIQAADPILRFPDGITWKGIFDSGFRPKHVSGLETQSCRISEQSFQFEFKGKPELFPLDRGTLTFQLKPDDSLRMIWHQSQVPVSMEEGQHRLEQFEKLMEGYMSQKGRMPVLLDKATATVRTEREFDSIALVDGHWINYGFHSSFVKDAPLIPHFHVTWRGYMGAPIVREKIVTPPEGYEWYSLDPKIDTPAPGISRPMSEVAKPIASEHPRASKRNVPPPAETPAEAKGLPLGLIFSIVVLLVVVAVTLIGRAIRTGKTKSK